MNSLFSIITNNSLKVGCSYHAKQRAVQRCKLMMRQYEREDPTKFLLAIYKQSVPDMGIIFSPFLYNKMCSKYGPNSFIRTYKNFTLMCQYDRLKNMIVIKSIMFKRNQKFF